MRDSPERRESIGPSAFPPVRGIVASQMGGWSDEPHAS